MAYLIEQAGGKASTGRQSILDIKPQSIDDCAPIFIGCREDVERAEEYIARYG
jgi:fructose-1,6-bisphosphatase I